MDAKENVARIAQAPVDEAFTDRWSPRSFSPDPLSELQIRTLFEASRWAPSCFNEQPWIYIYAVRNEDRQRFLSLLTEKNRSWARNAPLLLFIATRLHFSKNGKPNRSAEFDAGSAWMSLALCARRLGLYAHAMAGFDRKRCYDVLRVPEDRYKVMAAIAVGRKDAASKLPEDLRKDEYPSDRKPLERMCCEGEFGEEAHHG
jgi:nitroreductase